MVFLCHRFFLPAVLALVVSGLLALLCKGGHAFCGLQRAFPCAPEPSVHLSVQPRPCTDQVCLLWCRVVIMAFQVCQPFCPSFLLLVIFVLLALFSKAALSGPFPPACTDVSTVVILIKIFQSGRLDDCSLSFAGLSPVGSTC